VGEFEVGSPDSGFDFYEALVVALERMRAHGDFLRQAARMSDQNNLTEYALEHSRTFDLAWHQSLWGSDPMPEELRFATEYHAMASTYMTMSWILSGFPVPARDLATLITQMRGVGMDRLFEGATGGGNPYAL
jgi:hypothetical protein